MGGRVGVESVPGVGSTFWAEMPTAPSTPELTAGGSVGDCAGDGTETTEAEVPATGATLVYVEDNASNLRLVENILARQGHGLTLLSATTGPRGLALIRARRPDLVLLDLQLPGMNGEAILRELAAAPTTRDIPVIVLSADATTTSRQRLLAAGARAYLCKPLDMPAFLEAINAALEAVAVC